MRAYLYIFMYVYSLKIVSLSLSKYLTGAICCWPNVASSHPPSESLRNSALQEAAKITFQHMSHLLSGSQLLHSPRVSAYRLHVIPALTRFKYRSSEPLITRTRTRSPSCAPALCFSNNPQPDAVALLSMKRGASVTKRRVVEARFVPLRRWRA